MTSQHKRHKVNYLALLLILCISIAISILCSFQADSTTIQHYLTEGKIALYESRKNPADYFGTDAEWKVKDDSKQEIYGLNPPTACGSQQALNSAQPVNKGKNYVKYRNPDGSYTVAISAGVMNYYNGTDWDLVDTRIVDKSKTFSNETKSGCSAEVWGDSYRYLMEKAEYHAYFPEIFTDAAIKFTVGSYEFSFKTVNVGYTGEDNLINPGYTVSIPLNNTITYPDVFTDRMDVDAEYTLYKTGLKEFWILKCKPDPPENPDALLGFNTVIEYDTDMYIEGAFISPGGKPLVTSSQIEFRDKNGETVFRLPRPYALDANGEHVFCTYEIQKINGNILLKNLVPWSWLDDAGRTYPVRVDASPETLSAGFSVVCVEERSWDTGYISGGHWHNKVYRTGIDFDTTVIPDNATITKVELTLFVDDEGIPLNNDIGDMNNTAATYEAANNYAGFWADVDGNEYLSDSSGFAGLGSHTVELLDAAETDLQNRLGDNWFSVGFTGSTEADDKYRDGYDHSKENPPQIIVMFTTPTPTLTPTNTITPTPTLTPTNTITPTPTLTLTNTPTNTPTDTPTQTPTGTPTLTPTQTPTLTPTSTPTLTPTLTLTSTPTLTLTNTPTNTPTDTPTQTPTDTPTLTPTQTPTLTPTSTPTLTPTLTPTSTPTLTPTSTPTPYDTLYITGTDMAPSRVVRGEANVLMEQLYLEVDKHADGIVTLTSVTLEFYGNSTYAIADGGIHVYLDTNPNGIFDILDTIVGSGTFDPAAELAVIDIADVVVVSGIPQSLFITVDVSPSARLGDALGVSMNDPSLQIVHAPDQVIFTNTIQSDYSVVIDPVGPDVLCVIGVNLAPQYVQRNSVNNVMMGLNLWTLGSGDGLVFLDKIKITYAGTAQEDIKTNGIKIYEDINDNNSFDYGFDPLLGSGTFKNNIGAIDMDDYMVEAGRIHNLLLTLDINPEAHIGNIAAISIARKLDVEVYTPDEVELFPDTVSSDSVVVNNLWAQCSNYEYTHSSASEYSAFDLFYEDTGTVFGRVNQSMYENLYPGSSNDLNQYSMSSMHRPAQVPDHIAVDENMFFSNPYYYFMQSYESKTGWYAISYKLKDTLTDETLYFSDGVCLGDVGNQICVNWVPSLDTLVRTFKLGDTMYIRINTSDSDFPVGDGLLNEENRVSMFNLKNEKIYEITTDAFVKVNDPADYLSEIELSELNGFESGNMYWLNANLKESGADEFDAVWAFEICDLDELRVTGSDKHPATVYHGQKNILMYQLDMSCDNVQDGSVTLNGLQVSYTGTDPTDIATDGVRIFLDSNDNNVFDPELDRFLNSGSLGTGREVNLDLNDIQIIEHLPIRLFLTVDISPLAVFGNNVSIGITSHKNLYVVPPDRCKWFINLISGDTNIALKPTATLSPTSSPTETPTATPTYTPTFTPTATLSPTPVPTIDSSGPWADSCNADNENPLTIPEKTTFVEINAVIDDSTTENSIITGAEYFVGSPSTSGTGYPMNARDESFDSVTETVNAFIDTSMWTAESSPYNVWIHGVDQYNNWGTCCQIRIIVEKKPGENIPVSSVPGAILIICCITSIIILRMRCML